MNSINELSKLIKINKNDFTRVDCDFYGNPRYVVHYLCINDDYNTALNIGKSIGFTSYKGKQYGGCLVVQSYNIYDEIERLKKAIIEYNFNLYLWNSFDVEILKEQYKALKDSSHEKTYYKAFFEVFTKEYGYNLKRYNNSYSETITSYLQGLPSSLNIDFENYKIIELLNSFNIIDNDIVDSCSIYWVLLGELIELKFRKFGLIL